MFEFYDEDREVLDSILAAEEQASAAGVSIELPVVPDEERVLDEDDEYDYGV